MKNIVLCIGLLGSFALPTHAMLKSKKKSAEQPKDVLAASLPDSIPQTSVDSEAGKLVTVFKSLPQEEQKAFMLSVIDKLVQLKQLTILSPEKIVKTEQEIKESEKVQFLKDLKRAVIELRNAFETNSALVYLQTVRDFDLKAMRKRYEQFDPELKRKIKHHQTSLGEDEDNVVVLCYYYNNLLDCFETRVDEATTPGWLGVCNEPSRPVSSYSLT